MAKLYSLLFIGLVVALTLGGCQSAKKLYESGNYYQAVLKSVKKLRNNPDHKKSIDALKYAYPLAVDDLEGKISNVRISNPNFKNTYSVDYYEMLQTMHNEIKRSPAALKVIPSPKTYVRQLRESKEGAAEEQYSAGIDYLNRGGRENAKEAYAHFQMANSFVYDYKDVKNKIEEAYQAAILKIITELMPINVARYQLSSDFYYDQVVKVFREIEANEFIRFYNPQEARRIGLRNPEQVVTLEFIDFSVGDVFQQQRIEKVEKDSVVVGKVKLENGSTQNVYGTVNAKITINRMEVMSKGRVRLTIKDQYTNVTLSKEVFVGEHVWFNEWGNFNGDERALTKEQLDICERVQVMPPAEQDLFVEFTKPIHGQVRNHLIRFYNGF